MASYTQHERPIRVGTALGADALLLEAFSGEESVSQPYEFALQLLSQDSDIDAQALLGTGATVSLRLGGGQERVIHGLVRRFVQLGPAKDEELMAYRAEIVPWLWFLSLSTDCRIFQNLSVPEIVEQVFKRAGHSDFEFRCVKSYEPREYTVQYRETNLNFVSRLLEEEGIFYFFEYSSTKHVLVLGDDGSLIKPCPIQSEARFSPFATTESADDTVTSVHHEFQARPGTITLRDYDHLQPNLSLEASVGGDGMGEIYDYPGKYSQPDTGDRIARTQIEEQEALRELIQGSSVCRFLEVGRSFELKDHYRGDRNQAYQLLTVRHSAQVGDYRSESESHTEWKYRNEFAAVPAAVPYRPPRRAEKPLVHGSQTAVVVGKAGEEIWVDSHGRVKVQFFWDREGNNDENSSCWIRVASTWAGKGFGFISIPRIGQEVVVDFLEGDPDRPIITGRVYNARMTPPYGLPGNQTQTGIKSRSSKGDGGDSFNEIRLDDMKGSEHIFIQAEKDKQLVVKNDRSKSVGHDESAEIGNDRTESVGHDTAITIGNDESVSIVNDRTHSVGNDEKSSIGNNNTVEIGNNRSETIGSNHSATVGGNQRVRIQGSRTKGVEGNEATKIGKARQTNVGMVDNLNVGMSRMVAVGLADVLTVGSDLKIIAGRAVSIRAGRASISLNLDGTVKIKGTKIMIEGSDKVEVKSDGDIIHKANKIGQN